MKCTNNKPHIVIHETNRLKIGRREQGVCAECSRPIEKTEKQTTWRLVK